MRLRKIFIAAFAIFTVTTLALAEQKTSGIRDQYQIKLSEPIRVGNALLPPGDYEIRHVMEGQDHFMIFHPKNGKTADVKAKCTLESLPRKAYRNETVYQHDGNERVLRELTFQGDTAKHVF